MTVTIMLYEFFARVFLSKSILIPVPTKTVKFSITTAISTPTTVFPIEPTKSQLPYFSPAATSATPEGAAGLFLTFLLWLIDAVPLFLKTDMAYSIALIFFGFTLANILNATRISLSKSKAFSTLSANYDELLLKLRTLEKELSNALLQHSLDTDTYRTQLNHILEKLVVFQNALTKNQTLLGNLGSAVATMSTELQILAQKCGAIETFFTQSATKSHQNKALLQTLRNAVTTLTTELKAQAAYLDYLHEGYELSTMNQLYRRVFTGSPNDADSSGSQEAAATFNPNSTPNLNFTEILGDKFTFGAGNGNAASSAPKPSDSKDKSSEAAPTSPATKDDHDMIKQTIERLEAEKAAAAAKAEEGDEEPADTKMTCKKRKAKKRNGILREREKADRAGGSGKKEGGGKKEKTGAK